LAQSVAVPVDRERDGVSVLNGVRRVKKRLLVLTRYTRDGASSRLRTMQYRPWLEGEQFDVEYLPFFDRQYLRQVYGGSGRLTGFLGSLVRRLRNLPQEETLSLVWVEKEVVPWLPWLLEARLWPEKVPVVLDFDDAIFHRYDQHRSAAVRFVLGDKIDRAMARASLVTAGNRYLCDRAERAGATCVRRVPTVVDLDRYPVESMKRSELQARVGWIGTPQTWALYGEPMYRRLVPTLKRTGSVFVAVGAALEFSRAETLQVVPWSEGTEAEYLQSMDLGIMPLPKTHWAKGKCGYKLIQYMASRLPVIASPVGVNEEIVEHGVNGFLADSEEAWIRAVEHLVEDPALRHRMGVSGRRKVEEDFSLQQWAPQVATLLARVAL
jgi:glycosyltransferase involved in cell wall biosynthesis